VAIPFTLDLVTDLVLKPTDAKQSNEKIIVKEGFLNNTEKVLFLIGAIVLPVVAFFPENTTNWAFIYICCSKCQQCLIHGAVVISLCRYDSSAWTNKATYVIITSIGVGNVILCNTNNRSSNLTTSTYDILEIVGIFLVLLSCGVYSFFTTRWFMGLFKRNFDPVSKTQKISELVYPLVYTTMIGISFVTLVIIVSLYGRTIKHDEIAITITNILYFCYILLIIFLSMRMVKSEVIQGLYALIDSKKVYVRYISHELRTPLNAGNEI
jgi:hypothetical protein